METAQGGVLLIAVSLALKPIGGCIPIPCLSFIPSALFAMPTLRLAETIPAEEESSAGASSFKSPKVPQDCQQDRWLKVLNKQR